MSEEPKWRLGVGRGKHFLTERVSSQATNKNCEIV